MRPKFLAVIFLFAISFNAFGQDDYVLDKDSIKVKDRISYNFTMGAGFGYSSNAGEFFSTYYSPSITYDVSNRFKVRGGVTYINSMANNYPMLTEFGYTTFDGNISQYYTYVEGIYKVNDRLNVGGSIFYDFTEYQDAMGNVYNNQNKLNNIGYSGFFEYKLNDGMSIMGEIRVNDRNPYGNRFMGAAQHSFFGR